MKRSSGMPGWAQVRGPGLAVVLDLGGRLAGPASAVALAMGLGSLALVLAASMSGLAVLRGLVSGRLIEQAMCHMWDDVVQAAHLYPVTHPGRLRDDYAVYQLLHSVERVVQMRMVALPRLVADVLALLAMATALGWLAGLRWVLVGAVGFGLAALVMSRGQRRLRGLEQRAFELHREIGADLEALLLATAELRGQGREDPVGVVLLGSSRRAARAQRKVAVHASLVGMLPFSIALLVAIASLSSQRPSWLASLLANRVAALGALAGGAVVFGVAVLRGVAAVTRALPHRDCLAGFMRGARTATAGEVVVPVRRASTAARRPPDSGWQAPLVARDLSVVHPGGRFATPHRLRFEWHAPGGLVLLGDNGAGKTTTALAILGLVQPAEGELLLGGVPLEVCDLPSLRARVRYLPQSGFVEPRRSVEWHLRLLTGQDATDEQLTAALAAAGLEALLQPASGRGGLLDVPMGALSGGERRRVQMARLFVEAPEPRPGLFVVDEPEAGLDAAGRELLAARLVKLAARTRVLLVAHDRRVVPEGFAVVTCRRGPAPGSRRADRVVDGP